MPWALADRLHLTAMPKVAHFQKHGWTNVAMLTLCSKAPEAGVIHHPEMQWWAHVPLPDGQIRANGGDVWRARNHALSMLEAGHTTIIHCMAGRNRSGLIGALVLQQLENLTGPEALDRVRELRPRSVDNIHFEEFLMNLGRPR